MNTEKNPVYGLVAEIAAILAVCGLYLNNYQYYLVEVTQQDSLLILMLALGTIWWGKTQVYESSATHTETLWNQLVKPALRTGESFLKQIAQGVQQRNLSWSNSYSIPSFTGISPGHKLYILAGVSLIAGAAIAIHNRSVPIALISLIFAVGSTLAGRRSERRIQEKQNIIDELIQDKNELKEGLSKQRKRSEQLQKAKMRENRRLSNLKQALQRKGIDTDYLIDKYDEALYAPVMVLTHFSDPKNNSKEDAEFIGNNLDALDTEMLHGSARIVPPRNFDQEIQTKDGLQTWFDENVLGGRTDLAHKLEMISVVDVSQTFDRDASVDNEGPDFKTQTVSELFETDTVIPTEELLEILSRSERISLEEELRENIALLAVPSASEAQMKQLLEVQSDLEGSLGKLSQIAQTDVDEIESVFDAHEIDDSDQLSGSVKEEAERLNEILN